MKIVRIIRLVIALIVFAVFVIIKINGHSGSNIDTSIKAASYSK